MKKLLLLITALFILASVEGQILRYSNYTTPTPPEPEGPAEMLNNTTMDTTDPLYWSTVMGCSISGGVLSVSASSLAIWNQSPENMVDGGMAESTDYVLQFTITLATPGELATLKVTNDQINVDLVSSDQYDTGTHKVYFTTPSSLENNGIGFRVESSPGYAFSIDNISLKLDE